MMLKPEKSEYQLLGVVLTLLAFAAFGPQVVQPANQHTFADHRSWAHIPFAMDVLSNLPFAIWGAAGLACLWRLLRQTRITVQHGLATVFFAGLLLTAAASSCYHWQPDDAGLAIDRMGMVVAFAGLLGLAAAGRISDRAGALLTLAVLVLGPLSVWLWAASGNVLPWLALQFGGMAIILWLAAGQLQPVARAGDLQVRWGVVILIYVAAKLLELADHEVYALTSHLVSGHSLKHVVASCAAWPVLAALIASAHGQIEASAKSGQNRSQLARHGGAASAGQAGLAANKSKATKTRSHA